MNRYALFLNGRYLAQHLDYYRKLSRGTVKVAVDGGLRFFLKSGARPDLLLGDLDSLTADEISTVPESRVMRFMRNKNKTDSQLAVEYCLKNKADEISMIMPSVGEIDHFIANFLMITPLLKKMTHPPKLTVFNHAFRCDYLCNRKMALRSAVGDRVSIIPLRVSRLTCTGLMYGADRLLLKPGETVALRNRTISTDASVSIDGEGWLIRYYSRS